MLTEQQLNKMSPEARLERLANALPAKDIKYNKTKVSPNHDILFAYGKGVGEDGKDCWHAIFGYIGEIQIAQTMEISANTSEKDVQRVVIKHAETTVLSS